MIRPRDLLATPGFFGRKTDVEWKSDISVSLMHSAEVQHRCSRLMRKNIDIKFGSVKKYCDFSGQSYHRILSVLNGYVPISIRDIGQAVTLLGLSVEFIDQYSKTASDFASNTFVRDVVGAFYTPDDIALFMIDKVGIRSASSALEPSFGDGAFLRALRDRGMASEKVVGCEIDPAACEFALSEQLLDEDGLHKGDFIDYKGGHCFDAVVGNPPYVRLRSLKKDRVQSIINTTTKILGTDIGRESSLWLPFLIKAVSHVGDGGSIAFVLPFEITYVKYARSAWEYLGKNFKTIEVLRCKERLFEGILQDVVLFFAKGKGGSTSTVNYLCYETKHNLVQGISSINESVSLEGICAGDRVFQEALVDRGFLKSLGSSPYVLSARDEAAFRIGYVCGNKRFFHPDKETIKKYNISNDTLWRSISSSRQLSKTGLYTSANDSGERLWIPGQTISDGESRYIKFGEKDKVNEGYKCRIRDPWWRVPGIQIPDAIMSVFGGIPRVIVNDDGKVVSNSLLGIYTHTSSSEMFCETWYSMLTVLSIELQIHFLGGGVLVAVPNEAGSVWKLKSKLGKGLLLEKIDSCLKAGAVMDAYRASDELLKDIFGSDALSLMEKSVNLLREWRKS